MKKYPMTTDTLYRFFQDSCHGWLRVPMAHIRELDIADRISGFSYKNGEHAYLERDVDYRVFEEAFFEKFDIYPQLHWSTKENPAELSRIRNFEFFRKNILVDTTPSRTEMANKINFSINGSSKSFKTLMDLSFETIEYLYSELKEEYK